MTLWHYNFIVGKTISECMICKKPTRFLELNFQGPLHPGECDDKMWEGYERACRISDERERERGESFPF